MRTPELIRLADQVTSRELSDELVKAGVDVPSHFKWVNAYGYWKLYDRNDITHYHLTWDEFPEMIPAYTSSEIGVLLDGLEYSTHKKGDKTVVSFQDAGIEGKTEAEAKGTLLLRLLESGQLTKEDITLVCGQQGA